MVVPDRIVQAERLVAVAPAVPRPPVPLDHDRRHAQAAQPRAQRDAPLPAADHQGVGLHAPPELARLRRAPLRPGRLARPRPVKRALRPAAAQRLLEPLQLRHRRQQGPDRAAAHPDQAEPPRHPGLELDPRGRDPALLAGHLPLGDAEPRRVHVIELRRQHPLDRAAPLHRPDVPGEAHEVAPEPVRLEQGGGPRRVAAGHRRLQILQRLGHGVLRGGVEHASSLPRCVRASVAGGAPLRQAPRRAAAGRHVAPPPPPR